jgi:long-chain fatty acid transport protein
MRVAVAAAISMSVSGLVQASGFMIVEQSVREVGRSISGASASNDGLGSLYFNPAGITSFEGTQVEGALHVIVPKADFKGVRNPGAVPGTGTTDEKGLVPNLYFVTDINDKTKFGLGINAPFGLVTEYSPDWVGRYHAVRSDLKTININPTIGYKVNDKLSIGFGISAMYAEVELTQALDNVLVCAGQTNPSNPPAAIGACSALLGTTPGTGVSDGNAVLKGDDWGFGFNLGLQYDVNDATTLGLAYRSQVKQEFEGTATQNVILPIHPTFTPTPVRVVDLIAADLTLPDNLSFGLSHDFSPQWTVMADIAWTNWSTFDELKAVSRTDGSVVLQQPENWEDSWRYSLGVEYSPNNVWTWRGGVAFDETPIPNAELRTPRIPGEDRTWLSFGFSYAMSERMSFDFAYAHLFVKDAKINNTEETFGLYTLTGEFESTTDIISGQVTYRF